MYTEDDIAKDLRSGAMTLNTALRLMDGDEVYVYATEEIDPDTAKWDEMEDYASGSAELFSALRAVGATDEQMNKVGQDVDRLSAAGRTIQSLWPKS